MPPFEIFLAFLITTALFAYLPGPAMIYVSAQTIARGHWAGLMAALGVHLGGVCSRHACCIWVGGFANRGADALLCGEDCRCWLSDLPRGDDDYAPGES